MPTGETYLDGKARLANTSDTDKDEFVDVGHAAGGMSGARRSSPGTFQSRQVTLRVPHPVS